MTSLITYRDLNDTWSNFSNNIEGFISELGLSSLKLACDHVALRVNSLESAKALSQEFECVGNIISNNIINGRPILIFELNTPLILDNMSIDCVELPYPGDKTYPAEGWEHIELVLPCQAKTCEALRDELFKLAPQLESIITNSSDIKVKMSSPQGEHERLTNPTIAFKKGNICVKLHPHGIKDVIASEQAL
ncbi:VOC family protein [Shewanella atlantica]|uniref:VOC family protein n=1 Tax=Shewanella atlantica TaxID=271099 RepID=UPI0037363C88